jgi:hypothetical protein
VDTVKLVMSSCCFVGDGEMMECASGDAVGMLELVTSSCFCCVRDGELHSCVQIQGQ